MMKKQIFNLMLSAAIFTTSPLFAMDPSEVQHSCPSCKPDLRFQDVDEAEGLGALQVLPKEILLKTIKELSLDGVLKCFFTSKAMKNSCQEPTLWKHFAQKDAQKYTFAFQPDLCIKAQFTSHLNLCCINELHKGKSYADLNKIKYIVSTEQMKLFMQEMYSFFEDELDNTLEIKYKFQIGNCEFLMNVDYKNNYESKDQDAYIQKLLKDGNITLRLRNVINGGHFNVFEDDTDTILIKKYRK